MQFRDIRKKCGLTTTFVSQKLGVKITTLYKYEKYQSAMKKYYEN